MPSPHLEIRPTRPHHRFVKRTQRYSDKNETRGIEGDNARQRHWLARFRWRSIVVSKAKRMVDISFALFASFAGNDRSGRLISMLA